MSDFYSGNSVNCVLLDVNLYETKRKNNWSPIPKDTSIGAAIFILTLNHADVIGDQSDAVTQNAWFRCALCAAISGEISIIIKSIKIIHERCL